MNNETLNEKRIYPGGLTALEVAEKFQSGEYVLVFRRDNVSEEEHISVDFAPIAGVNENNLGKRGVDWEIITIDQYTKMKDELNESCIADVDAVIALLES